MTIPFIQTIDDRLYTALLPETTDRGVFLFWRAITHLGDFEVLFAFMWVVFAWLVFKRRVLLGLWLLSGFLLGLGVNSVVKSLVNRPRPFAYAVDLVTHGASFPSGHSAGSMIVACLVGVVGIEMLRSMVLRRVVQILALSLAGTVAVSRVMLGVHWGADVVGGLFLGGLWSFLWWKGFSRTRLFSLASGDLYFK